MRLAALLVSLLIGVIAPAAAATLPANHQGLWWARPAGSESGWGLNIAQQGNAMFGVWFTYNASGEPEWFALNLSPFSEERFDGRIYRVTGPAFTTAAFDSSQVKATDIGYASLRFFSADGGTLIVTMGTTIVEKSITRQAFGPLPTCGFGLAPGASPNFTDMWWNSPSGSESGWGMFVTHQGDNAFVTWFTYDTDGRALWFAGNTVRNGAVFSGTLYATSGPPFEALPWDSSRVSVRPVGTATLAFTDANNGSFTYDVSGTRGFKAITRVVFSVPATVCR